MTKDNVRVFFPVGMGGFSFERMDEAVGIGCFPLNIKL